MREAHAVDALRTTDVGAAVAAQGYLVVRGQPAGHARGPEQLVADRAVDDLVDLGELPEGGAGVGMNAGDELDLRLAEVGGDVRMGERRAEQRRMRRRGQQTVRLHAQAFL